MAIMHKDTERGLVRGQEEFRSPNYTELSPEGKKFLPPSLFRKCLTKF